MGYKPCSGLMTEGISTQWQLPSAYISKGQCFENKQWKIFAKRFSHNTEPRRFFNLIDPIRFEVVSQKLQSDSVNTPKNISKNWQKHPMQTPLNPQPSLSTSRTVGLMKKQSHTGSTPKRKLLLWKATEFNNIRMSYYIKLFLVQVQNALVG